jgi:hypothetical protein
MGYIIPKKKKSPAPPKKSPAPPQTIEFYSKKHHIVFYHITKCGMTTVRNFLECDRIPVSKIPHSPPLRVVCVIREPTSRLISAFLCLRGFKRLHLQYQVYATAPMFRKKFYELPLTQAFVLMVDQLAKMGPFDTHLQRQVTFLGPSNTIQNEYTSSRSPDKVTDWVLLSDLDNYCQKQFGLKPPHRNSSAENATVVLKKLVQESPHIQNQIKQIYMADFDLFEKIVANNIQ